MQKPPLYFHEVGLRSVEGSVRRPYPYLVKVERVFPKERSSAQVTDIKVDLKGVFCFIVLVLNSKLRF